MSELITKISISWCDEDVKHQANEIGEKLTDKEISEVLYQVEKRHDASMGITWDTISYWVQEIVFKREKE